MLASFWSASDARYSYCKQRHLWWRTGNGAITSPVNATFIINYCLSEIVIQRTNIVCIANIAPHCNCAESNPNISIHTGYGRDVVIVAHNTTIKFTCTDGRHNPTWFVNETTVGTEGHGYRTSTIIKGTEKVTATLTVNGNIICDTLNIHCEAFIDEERQFVPMHNTTVKVQGWLLSSNHTIFQASFPGHSQILGVAWGWGYHFPPLLFLILSKALLFYYLIICRSSSFTWKCSHQ